MYDRFRVRIHVPYDTAAIARVIAPLLDFEAGVLAKRLDQGPMRLPSCSRSDAVSLAQALSHFGVIGDIEPVAHAPADAQRRVPRVSPRGPLSRAGRYVLGPITRRRPAGDPRADQPMLESRD